jgi:hypothetical protein
MLTAAADARRLGGTGSQGCVDEKEDSTSATLRSSDVSGVQKHCQANGKNDRLL